MFLKNDREPPKFEQNVQPTMTKLPASDGALLGEWCAEQYGAKKDAVSKLACLTLANQLAKTTGDEALESRIEFQLSAQVDETKVREILDGKACDELLGFGLVDSIIERYENESSESRISPGTFVKLLLCEGARRAAESVVKPNRRFTMEDFRVAAWRVHSACAALAEGHSEIDVSKEALNISKKIVEEVRKELKNILARYK